MSFHTLFELARQTLFYDLKSTALTACFLLSFYFLTKLLKDKGDAIFKTLKYLTYLCVSFGIVLILY